MDPEVVIACRRATAFARAWRGGGPLRATLRASWEAYAAVNHPATSADGLQEAQPIAPPGWAGRAGWRRDVPCQGPVGLLLQSLLSFGMKLVAQGDDLRILQYGEAPLSIGGGSIQAVADGALCRLQRARRRMLQREKPNLWGIANWDHGLSRAQASVLPPEDKGLWGLLQSGQWQWGRPGGEALHYRW